MAQLLQGRCDEQRGGDVAGLKRGQRGAETAQGECEVIGAGPPVCGRRRARRAGTTNPSGNPSLGFAAEHGIAAELEPAKWFLGGRAVRGGMVQRVVGGGGWRRQAAEHGMGAEGGAGGAPGICGSCGLLLLSTGFGRQMNVGPPEFCSWTA